MNRTYLVLSSTQNGFTLLEVILTVSLLVALMGGTVIMTNMYREENDRDLSASMVYHALRTSQFFAIAGRDDGPWGVHVEVDGVTVFQGPSYAGRNTERDDRMIFPVMVEVGGDDEFVFESVSGNPSGSGMVVLSHAGDNAVLLVDDRGIVSYGP